MRNVNFVKRVGLGVLITGLATVLSLAIPAMTGCTGESSPFSGSGKWRTFGSPNSNNPPVTAAKTDPKTPSNGLADSRRVAPRQNNDPRAKMAEKQVSEEVRQLMQAMEKQSQRGEKTTLSPKPTPAVGDSDSLAAKLAQPNPTPTPAPAVAKPVITRPTDTVATPPTQERPVITPIRRAPAAVKSAPDQKAPALTPAPTPAAAQTIRITNIEAVPVARPTIEPTPSPTPQVTPTVAIVRPTIKPLIMPKRAKPTPIPTPMATPILTQIPTPTPTLAPTAAPTVAPTPVATVVAAPAPANTGAKIDIPNPDNPNAAMDTLLFRLEEKLKDRPEDTATQVKLRLVYAVLGQWQQALKQKGGKDTSGGEMARSVASLVKAFDNPDLSSAQQANEALQIVEKMQQSLRAQADMVVSDLQLCCEVSSFGCFRVMPEGYFVSGKSLPVIVYLELENFTSKYLTDRKIYQTLLSMTIEVLKDSGRSVWRQRYEKIEDTANRQRNDFYLAPQITLPPALPAGPLKLKITVEDLHGNKVAQRAVSFDLRERR